MSVFDGNASEMPEHRPVDDGAIEAAIAGATRGEPLDALTSFVTTVRSAAEAAPAPSTAMVAFMATGFSTEKGDLPATAASNVYGPAPQEAGLSKWGKAKMKIKGFLAGLGIAGKIALGVGVAAAATGGAGATGMLPFSVPGIGHAHHHQVAANATTTTTQAAAPAVAHSKPTRHPRPQVINASTRIHAGTDGIHGTVTSTTTDFTTTTGVTTTTVFAPTPTPTTTDTTSPPATTTTTATTPPPVTTTTDTTPPTDTTTTTSPAGLPIQLSCSVTGATQVTCTWTAAPTAVAQYALWRWTTGGDGSDYAPIYESPNGLTFVDNNVTPGVPFTYRVFTTLSDSSQGPVSNRVHVS